MARKKDINSSIAQIIRSELGFTNGWVISEESYNQHCEKAAKRIITLLKRRKLLADSSAKISTEYEVDLKAYCRDKDKGKGGWGA